MRPCVSEDMHCETACLEAGAFCKNDRVTQELTVGVTDETVLAEPFFKTEFRIFFRQLSRQKMIRSPDSGDILQTEQVGPCVCQFPLCLRRGSRIRSFDPVKQRA